MFKVAAVRVAVVIVRFNRRSEMPCRSQEATDIPCEGVPKPPPPIAPVDRQLLVTDDTVWHHHFESHRRLPQKNGVEEE